MAFHHSSDDIDLTGGVLIADCRDCGGNLRHSELNLDQHLGNANGFFEWGGVNFSHSAKNIAVFRDGDGLSLTATLRTQHNSWRDAKVSIGERVANIDGELKYIGGQEPQIEHSREFLGEERDFLSAAISDTFSDLRELFTSSPLFTAPSPRRRQQPAYGSRFDTELVSVHDDLTENPSLINLEDSISSVRTTVNATKDLQLESVKEEPLAYDELKEVNLEQREAQEDEEMILREVKEFLLAGNGRSVQSTKTETGRRKFVLIDDEASTTRTLSIGDRTLFDQDEFRRDSISEASDHGRYQARCMTPSVVDGEEEYDFLD